MLDMIASGIPFDGVWTSGIDNVIVDAMVEEGVFKPIVGADNSQFVQYLGTVEGLQGAAVTNPGSVGGAGVTLALADPERRAAGHPGGRSLPHGHRRSRSSGRT